MADNPPDIPPETDADLSLKGVKEFEVSGNALRHGLDVGPGIEPFDHSQDVFGLILIDKIYGPLSIQKRMACMKPQSGLVRPIEVAEPFDHIA
jgi:hypothetical protein